MKFVVALVAAVLLFASPAKAVDELVGLSIAEVIESAKPMEATHRVFSAEEMTVLNKMMGPQPKPGNVGVVTVDNKTVFVVISRENIITYNGPAQPKEAMDKMFDAARGVPL